MMMNGMKQNSHWELLKDYFKYGYWDTDTHLLGVYAKNNELGRFGRIKLAFQYSTCYNVPTAIWLFENMKLSNVDEMWARFKTRLIFQTDRKWVRITDTYPQLYKDFMRNFNPSILLSDDFDLVLEEFTKLKGQGRVASYIFIDGLIATEVLTPSMPKRFDWNNGQTCTEGMLHAIDKDERAENFKKGQNKLSTPEIDELDQALNKLLKELADEGVIHDNICDYESNLCAFRKYFKDHMYIGYYLDRQLEEIQKLQQNLPEYSDIWDNMYTMRINTYPLDMLGEIGGWKGIRKELFTTFKRTGNIR